MHKWCDNPTCIMHFYVFFGLKLFHIDKIALLISDIVFAHLCIPYCVLNKFTLC